MLRAAVIAGLLAATGGCASHAREPRWPKFHERTADGGESLAPHKASPIADTPSDDGDLSVVDTVIDKPAAKAEEKSVGPEPPLVPTVKMPDDILNIDDIIIDIDD